MLLLTVASLVLVGAAAAAAASWVPISRSGPSQLVSRESGTTVHRFHVDGRWVSQPDPPDNPFDGVRFYVDPDSQAAKDAAALRTSDPTSAALIDRIATRPQAKWVGDWLATSQIRSHVEAYVSAASTAGTLPVFVVYAVPHRDCGQYSAGGLTASAYKTWIREVASGIGGADAAVVLEPDALAGMDCLTSTQRQERLALISDAVQVLAGLPRTGVYLDAGHSTWHSPSVIANRLKAAGIGTARGFSLNVSNFNLTSNEVAYGKQVSALVGNKPFIVDTSRNGRGPGDTWCNPRGRGLGAAPTASTREPLVDAYFWIKRPGESDGECGTGDPPAGQWWRDGALELARNAA